MRRVIHASVILTAMALGAVGRAATDAEVQSMRGLQALRVVVENLPESATKLGLSHYTMQTVAEAHLQQQYHITLSAESPIFVYIKCAVVGPFKGVVGYHLRVEFRQMITLTRDPNLQLVAATWAEDATVMTPESKFSQSVQSELESLLDKFGYAFMEANAK